MHFKEIMEMFLFKKNHVIYTHKKRSTRVGHPPRFCILGNAEAVRRARGRARARRCAVLHCPQCKSARARARSHGTSEAALPVLVFLGLVEDPDYEPACCCGRCDPRGRRRRLDVGHVARARARFVGMAGCTAPRRAGGPEKQRQRGRQEEEGGG